MLLINLDDDKNGIAFINGVGYRVTGAYGSHGGIRWPLTAADRALTIELRIVEALDEEQQRKRIARLETDLQNERDRLDEIRHTLNGDDEDQSS